MVSNIIRKVRCDDVLDAFMLDNRPCVFFTLTTADVVDIYEIRKRWRNLRHYLIELLPSGTKYVMNYEIHPNGHGWHIHAVFNSWIPLFTKLNKIQSFGFGRVNVQKVYRRGVADYLSKHALKAYRGVSKRIRGIDGSFRLRLVNTSRGLPSLDSYSWKSEFKLKVNSWAKRLKDGERLTMGHETFVLSEIAQQLNFKKYLSFWSQLNALICQGDIDKILQRGDL